MKKVNQIKTILPIILGCSKNIADSEYLLGKFAGTGIFNSSH
jgi:tRNA A37 methylthiotransferase MiaB